MAIKITLPNGLTAEADTITEAGSLLRLLGGIEPTCEPEPAEPESPKYPKGMKRVRNRDLVILEEWGLNDHEVRKAMKPKEWKALADSMDRTEQSVRNLAFRFANGAYELAEGGLDERVIIHADKH